MAGDLKTDTRNHGRTVLVTGGAGFIGSHLVRCALAAGHRVINLDKLTYAGNRENLRDVAHLPNYEFIKGDVADRALTTTLLGEIAPDTVFHLAAESHVDRSIDAPADFIFTNLVGTFTLLSAALSAWTAYEGKKRRNFRFIHVSTDEVFGELGQIGTFDETTGYNPSSPYSASKAGSDHLARAWHRTYGLPVIVTNCANNYGPCQYPEKLIPTIIRNALAGVEIPIYGKGENIRDWIYVEDHAQGLMQAAEAGAPGATYLFGSRSERSNHALCRMICEALDGAKPAKHGRSYAEQIAFVQDRPGHDFRYAIDPTQTCKALGWTPATELEGGLCATVAWYLNHPERLAGPAIPERKPFVPEAAADRAAL